MGLNVNIEYELAAENFIKLIQQIRSNEKTFGLDINKFFFESENQFNELEKLINEYECGELKFETCRWRSHKTSEERLVNTRYSLFRKTKTFSDFSERSILVTYKIETPAKEVVEGKIGLKTMSIEEQAGVFNIAHIENEDEKNIRREQESGCFCSIQ